jgi:hypothetical protein
MSARLHIHGPIPHPSTWHLSPEPEPPAGFMRLAACSITPRVRSTAGTDLIPREDIEALPPDVARLLKAYARLDTDGRLEVLRHAEQLAGTAR